MAGTGNGHGTGGRVQVRVVVGLAQNIADPRG